MPQSSTIRHKLRGREWRVRFSRLRKDCGQCVTPDRVITIHRSLKGELLLDTVIHECLHACLPDLDEDAVDETATDIARLLVRMGWSKE